MMEQKLQTEQGRNGIRMALGTIIDMAELIEKIKPASSTKMEFSREENVIYSNGGFTAGYRDSNDQLYEIKINKRSKTK